MLPKSIYEPVHLNNLKVSIDSGAHTLYKAKFAPVEGKWGKRGKMARENADYQFTDSQEFKSYLEKYIQFLCENKHYYEMMVTLDIIGSGEKSWEIMKYMESYGLKIIPVYHFGEDIKWIKKMVDEYEYIGVGGIGQDISKKRFMPFGDAAFRVVCGDSKRPRVKVHGFAMGSPEMMKRYPWYSCDQSTWTYMARCGTALIPRPLMKNGRATGPDYLSMHFCLPCAGRRRYEKTHSDYLTPNFRKWIEEYLELNKVDYDELGEYLARDVLNIRWFKNMERALKGVYEEKFDFAEGANILFAGTASSSNYNQRRFTRLLKLTGEQDLHFLCSYYYLKHATEMNRLRRLHGKGMDLRHASLIKKRKKVVMEKKEIAPPSKMGFFKRYALDKHENEYR